MIFKCRLVQILCFLFFMLSSSLSFAEDELPEHDILFEKGMSYFREARLEEALDYFKPIMDKRLPLDKRKFLMVCYVTANYYFDNYDSQNMNKYLNIGLDIGKEIGHESGLARLEDAKKDWNNIIDNIERSFVQPDYLGFDYSFEAFDDIKLDLLVPNGFEVDTTVKDEENTRTITIIPSAGFEPNKVLTVKVKENSGKRANLAMPSMAYTMLAADYAETVYLNYNRINLNYWIEANQIIFNPAISMKVSYYFTITKYGKYEIWLVAANLESHELAKQILPSIVISYL